MAKKKSAPLPPTPEARESAFAEIRRSMEPLTAKQLSGLLQPAFKIPEPVLVPILDEFVANGALYAIPPATAKGKSRYWDRDLVSLGQLLIVRAIQKKGPQPKVKLKAVVKGLDDDQFQRSFQNLVDSRLVREHPPLGKSKVFKYGTEPPIPEPYLKEIGKQLEKVFAQLLSAGVEPNSMTRIVRVWLDQAGLPVTKADESAAPMPSLATSELNLLLLMRQIEPGADRGALVSARELRRMANLDKLAFDQSVLTLARQGRLMLHRHDHASGLTAAERDELVTDGAGIYYVGMALRRTDA